MDAVMNQSNPSQSEREAEAGFQGAIIDDQGREIPITEAMIQRACRVLEESCPWARLRQDA
jgi:hypothetical protein